VIPAPHTTTLSTRGSGVSRTQRVTAWAGPMVDRIELDTAILHLAPVALETPVAWAGRADFVGITPQGLVRRWEPGESGAHPGEISAAELDPGLLPPYFNAAVISEQECPSCHALFAAARHCGACVAVTAGPRPATVHLPAADGGQARQTSIPQIVAVRDDLGAGDVFAAAFFVALSERLAPLLAATFGNAAAAIRIAGIGPSAIGGRPEIEGLFRAGEPAV
jgi:hypothetical protein